MTSMDVATEATSPRVPAKILKRELLWEGGVIKIKIPIEAKEGCFGEDGKKIPFLQFARGIKGGVINFYIHTDDPTHWLGTKINAEVQIYRKDLDGGRSFIYIDLRPVSTSTEVTHRLLVTAGPNVQKVASDIVVFETPAPLQGTIFLTKPDHKAVDPQTLTAPATAPAPAAKPAQARVSSTGDAQLDRLLAAGWNIDHDASTGGKLLLFKGEGANQRTMNHCPPKKKK